MRIIADFQLHSKFSRATSKNMDTEHLSKGAKLKGLNLLGTGDISHPIWLQTLENELQEIPDSGLFKFDDMLFMLTGEVSTIYNFNNKNRKIHHVYHLPSLEIAKQMNEAISKFGNLKFDGRPILKMSSSEFVEICMNISKDIFIYPSHMWTSWFGALGEYSGFNSLEECYQDQIKNIFASETGMSSDPAMNWRISALDKFTLLSSSDSHSPNPWRLGREANVFDIEKITYWEIHNAIKNKDKKKFLFTIETSPFYGKYHFTGHKDCGISLEPKEAVKLNNICQKCKRKLTIGVAQRVEQLIDRPEGFIPKNAIPFKTLLPLYEIISYATGVGQLYNKKVLAEHDKLIAKFENELNVLLNISKEELVKITNEKIADAIIKVRDGKINYVAGYDGEYGIPIFDEKEFVGIEERQNKAKFHEQKSLTDF